MTVTQTKFVSRVNVPSAVAATSTEPSIPVVDRFWEPQALFIHDWAQPCRVSSAWQTVISRSRTGSVQRNGISDKPKVNAYYQSKCFNQDHWRNLKEMMSKQEVCRYASPLHSDACHGVVLFDPQAHRFSTTSSLSTRRLFSGQHAFIANAGESSMWNEFTLSKMDDVNRVTKRITFATPLRLSQYSEPSIDAGYTLIDGKNPPPSWIGDFPTYWGYASGVNVTMWAKKSWSTGNPTTIGGYQSPIVAGVETVRYSRAFAVVVKPDDQIVHISYTMCRNNQSITLEPTRVKAVQGSRVFDANGVPTYETTDLFVQPTWTTILDYTESGVVGGSTPNQPTNFSHQRVTTANPQTPTQAQIRTSKVVIKRTTVTKEMCDTLAQADVCVVDGGQFAVVVEGQLTGSAGTSTTSNNAVMQAVIVVRDGFVTPIGGSANLVAALDSYFMGHISQDTPASLTNKDYPSGTSFPNLIQTIVAGSNAPKSKMIALQVMTYGNSNSPLPLLETPIPTENLIFRLYPSSAGYPNGLQDPPTLALNEAKATASTNNDVSVQIFEISDIRAQEEPVAQKNLEFAFTSRYASTTPAPTSPSLTPFLFSIGLVLNPTIKKPLRIYPAIEADASPPQMSSIAAQTSTIGTTTISATQTSGKPALDSPDVLNANGWDIAAYPKFQSNPKNLGVFCNGSSDYPTTHIDAPLLIGKFDYSSGMLVGIGSSVNSEQIGIGRSVEAYSEKPHKEFTVSTKFLKRDNAWKFLELWNNRRGRLLPVWFPSPANSIRIISADPELNEVYLEDTDKVVISTTHGYKFLYISTNDGGHYILSISTYNKVKDVIVATVDTTLNVNSSQTCGLALEVGNFINESQIRRATSAHLCFFDSDELDEEWVTDEVMTASFRLIEQPDFVPDATLGIVDPETGCGTCCGVVNECAALGGQATGCPNGCCICKTDSMKLRLTVNCFDGCYPIDDPTNEPLQCYSQICRSQGNLCTPSGAKETEIALSVAESSCSVLVFRKPSTCFGGDAIFSLNMKTRQWSIVAGHLLNACCAGSGCQCPPTGQCCFALNCNYDCGFGRTEGSCLNFSVFDTRCATACDQEIQSCITYKCGQTGGGSSQPLTNCCGGVDPQNPSNSMGRLRMRGEIINDWGLLGTTTGCSGCAGCI